MGTHGTNLRICSREQLIMLQGEAGRALENLPMNVAHNIQGDRTRFRERVLKMAMEEFSFPTLGLMEQQLKSFFKEVFGIRIVLPNHDLQLTGKRNALMFVPWDFTEGMIIDAYRKKWDYSCPDFHPNLLDRSLEQPRPDVDPGYCFTFHLGLEPDEKTLGKFAHKGFSETGIQETLSLKEYLLSSGFMKFQYDEFMDTRGTKTIVSSRESKHRELSVQCEKVGKRTEMRIVKDHISPGDHPKGGSRSIVLCSELF